MYIHVHVWGLKVLEGGRLAVFVLHRCINEWVVKTSRLAKRSTHWPVGWLEVEPLTKNPDFIGKRVEPLANTF